MEIINKRQNKIIKNQERKNRIWSGLLSAVKTAQQISDDV